MDGNSRFATLRVGEDEDDETPELKYNLEDHLGNSSVMVDEDGLLVNREEYYPYGDTSFGAFAKKRYRYNGKEKDNESGLYNYGMRYYAPWMCRFVSVDPLAPKYPFYSPYQYAGNKPISYVDIDGLEDNSGTPPAPTSSHQLAVGGTDIYQHPISTTVVNERVERAMAALPFDGAETLIAPVTIYHTGTAGVGTDAICGYVTALSTEWHQRNADMQLEKTENQLAAEMHRALALVAGASGSEAFLHFQTGGGAPMIHEGQDNLAQLAAWNENMHAVQRESEQQIVDQLSLMGATVGIEPSAMKPLDDNEVFDYFMLEGFGRRALSAIPARLSLPHPDEQLPIKAVVGGIQELEIIMTSLLFNQDTGDYMG